MRHESRLNSTVQLSRVGRCGLAMKNYTTCMTMITPDDISWPKITLRRGGCVALDGCYSRQTSRVNNSVSRGARVVNPIDAPARRVTSFRRDSRGFPRIDGDCRVGLTYNPTIGGRLWFWLTSTHLPLFHTLRGAPPTLWSSDVTVIYGHHLQSGALLCGAGHTSSHRSGPTLPPITEFLGDWRTSWLTLYIYLLTYCTSESPAHCAAHHQ